MGRSSNMRPDGACREQKRGKNLEPRPCSDQDVGAMAAHADAVGRQVKALYQGTDKQEFRA